MFTKVQIYCKEKDCCFDDIKNSCKPYVLINTDQICLLGPKTDWGFCTGYRDYPFRVLDMKNGDTFLVVLESANELEKLLFHGIGNEKQEWSEDDDFMVENVRNSFGLHCGQMTPALQEQYRKFFDKVKAIKLQPNWKPSEEQIKSLYNSIPDAALYERDILTQLYVDLKKLTE